MTTPDVDRRGRWVPTVREDRLRRARGIARVEFGDEFPGVTVWFGLTSQRWRAMVPAAGGWRLLESAQPDDLRMQIRGALKFGRFTRDGPLRGEERRDHCWCGAA